MEGGTSDFGAQRGRLPSKAEKNMVGEWRRSHRPDILNYVRCDIKTANTHTHTTLTLTFTHYWRDSNICWSPLSHSISSCQPIPHPLMALCHTVWVLEQQQFKHCWLLSESSRLQVGNINCSNSKLFFCHLLNNYPHVYLFMYLLFVLVAKGG